MNPPSNMLPKSEEGGLRRIGRTVLILAVLAPVVALAVGAKTAAILSIAVGGLLAAMNFSAIQAISRRVVRGSVRTQSLLMALLVMKMTALIVLVYLLIRTVGVDPVGFVIGLTTLVAALLIESVRVAIWDRPAQEGS